MTSPGWLSRGWRALGDSTEDRVFTAAFGVSAIVHLTVLVGPLLPVSWFRPLTVRRPVEVVYNYDIADEDLRHLEQHLERAAREALATPSPTAGRPTQIRVPERPSLAAGEALPALPTHYSATIDLTNLTEAAQGDPILLSYFSAIREQIQRTANSREWLTLEAGGGIIYLSFVLHANGRIEQVRVVRERSAASGPLQDIALRIVENSAPFPAFPPSIDAPQKTIVVPLEFLLGS